MTATLDESGVWDNDSQSWVNPGAPNYDAVIAENNSQPGLPQNNYGAGGTAAATTSPASTGSSGTSGSFAPPAQPPTGLPTAAQAGADAPLPLQSFGATPTVTPSYASAATVNPQISQAQINQGEALNAQALAPTFQNQDQTNQDQLAARGISSSGAAADLTNQLYQGQSATLAQADVPLVSQGMSYGQADIAANQTNEQGTNLFNAGEGTAASGTNAGYYDQAVTGDATTYNNYLSTIEGQGYNTSNEAYTAYLNSFGPNSGVTSSFGGAVQGIGNAATGAYDSSVAGEGAALGGIAGGAGAAAAGGAFA